MGKTKYQTITSRTEFFYYAFRNILLVSLPLVLISAFLLSLPQSSATISGADNIQLNLSTSCTIDAVVTSEHSVSLNGGQLDNNVGNTKLSAFCNDNNGYGIYAIGSSNDIDGNTELINTVNESYNIRTGVYDSNNTVNPSSWAMKLTAGSGTGIDPVSGDSVPTTPPSIVNGYDDYSNIPSNYTLVAKRTSGTSMTPDTSVSGSYLNTTYQIYANSAQPSGTYNGKVKYIMIHPSNNTNNISTLEAAFAAAGKAKGYSDGTSSNLYYSMQDMTTDICNSVTSDGEITATQLIDIRDDKLYWIAKLADGHCWMTQNLDLDIGDTNMPLTSENTDISATASGSGIYSDRYTENNGVWTWTPSNTAINGSTSNWVNTSSTPYYADGEDTYYFTSNSSADDIEYASLPACTAAGHTETGCRHYHSGNYYNWTAAVASNNSNSISNNYAEVGNSICPKGWRLPIATNSDKSIYEFGDLLFKYNITPSRTGGPIGYKSDGFDNIRKAPLWLTRSGRIDNGAFNNRGIYGYYWSSVNYNGSYAYRLDFSASSIWLASIKNDGKNMGRSIRCVAR